MVTKYQVKLTLTDGTTDTRSFANGIIPTNFIYNLGYTSRLKSVEIGSGIKQINSSAFEHITSNWTELICYAEEAPVLQSLAFNSASLHVNVLIPYGADYSSWSVGQSIHFTFENMPNQYAGTFGFYPQQYALNCGGSRTHTLDFSLTGPQVTDDEDILVFFDGDVVVDRSITQHSSKWNDYCSITNYGWNPPIEPQVGGIYVTLNVQPYNEVTPEEIYPVVVVRVFKDNTYTDYYYTFCISNDTYTSGPRHSQNAAAGTSIGTISFGEGGTNIVEEWFSTNTNLYCTITDIDMLTVETSSSEGWASVILGRASRSVVQGMLFIEYDKNEGYDRQTTITVQGIDTSGNLIQAIVTLKQKGKLGEKPQIAGSFYLSTRYQYFPFDGSVVQCDLTADNCRIETLTITSKVDWITVTKFNDYSYVLSIAENPNAGERFGTVVFMITDFLNNTLVATFNAQQEGQQKYQPEDYEFFFTNHEYNTTYSAKAMQIMYQHKGMRVRTVNGQSHIDWSGSTSSSWITWDNLNDDYNISPRRLRILANNGGTRIGTASLSGYTNSGILVTDTITIVQKPKQAIIFNNDTIFVDSLSGTKVNMFSASDGTVINSASSDETWCSVLSSSTNSITVGFDNNPSSESRECTVQVFSSVLGTNYVNEFKVLQQGAPEILEFPIWKDTYYDYEGDLDYIDYRFSIGNKIAYEGRAYLMNGKARIKVNDILKSFLIDEMVFNKDQKMTLIDNKEMLLSTLTISTDNWVSYENVYRYCTYCDWSYEEHPKACLNVPILSCLDDRQLIFYTVRNKAGEMPTTVNTLSNSYFTWVYKVEGSVSTVLFSPKQLRKTTIRTSKIPVLEVDPWVQFTNSKDNEYTEKLTPKRTCFDYALYYQNKFGGWDYMLFNRTSKQTDKITPSKFVKNINNNNLEFGTVTYNKDILEQWTLKTPYLTDEQSLILSEHLLTSTKAFLHELDKNEIHPVNIEATTADHLTFFNNSKKMCRYSITVSDAQNKFNR